MAVDRTMMNTALQSDPALSRMDFPIVSEQFLKELQVPPDVINGILKDQRLLVQFFSAEGARFRSLTQPERLKADSGEQPDFETVVEPELQNFQPLSLEEERALDSFRRDLPTMIRSQSPGGDLNELIQQTEQYIDQYLAENPDALNDLRSSPTGGGFDPLDNVIDDLFMNEISKNKSKFEEEMNILIANAKDPETIMLALAYKNAGIFTEKAAKAMEVLSANMDRSRIISQELTGGSTGDLAKANADLARTQSISSMASFAIQSGKQQVDQTYNIAQSVIGSIHEAKRSIISKSAGIG